MLKWTEILTNILLNAAEQVKNKWTAALSYTAAPHHLQGETEREWKSSMWVWSAMSDTARFDDTRVLWRSAGCLCCVKETGGLLSSATDARWPLLQLWMQTILHMHMQYCKNTNISRQKTKFWLIKLSFLHKLADFLKNYKNLLISYAFIASSTTYLCNWKCHKLAGALMGMCWLKSVCFYFLPLHMKEFAKPRNLPYLRVKCETDI